MRSLKSVLIAAALVIGITLLFAASASATTVTYDWTLTGPTPGSGGLPFPGSGTITATVGMSGDAISEVTGTIDGSAIIAPISFGGSDNLLFPTGTTFVDTKGIAFDTAAGQDIWIFSFFAEGTPPSGNAYGEETSDPNGFGVGTFTLTATPLPSTWSMMILGLCGFSFFAARWTKKPANTFESA